MTSTVTQRYVAPENMQVISYKAYIITAASCLGTLMAFKNENGMTCTVLICL